MIKSLHLAIVIVILTGWYNESIGIGLKILITILAVFIFIALFANDFLKDKKVRQEKLLKDKKVRQDTINYFSTAIDEILNSLHDVWNKYQEATKDIYQQKKVAINTNALHFIPAEFRPMLPDDWQWNVTKLYPIPLVLLKNERTQIDKFCCSIIKIISLYKRIQDLGSGSYDANYLLELRTQWKSLVTEVLERGNPLKEKP